MNKEYFGKVFCGPYLSTKNVINTGGVYLITPIIQTGSMQILDVRQTYDIVSELNDQDLIKFWHTLSRNFGGFAYFIHYELNEFCRLELLYQFRETYNIPKIRFSQLRYA